MSRSCSLIGSVATNFDSLYEPVGVAVLVAFWCGFWLVGFLVCQALAAESWLGGFYCRFPVRMVGCLFVRLFLESNTSGLLFGQIFILHAAGILDDFVLILAFV